MGRAIARRLAGEGCDVAICARNEGPLRASADEIAAETGRRVVPLACDTGDATAIMDFVDRAADSLGGIHIVVNNAARVMALEGEDPIETVRDADVLRDFEEKVLGYMRIVRAAVPYLKKGGWGRVINISGGTARAPGVSVSPGIRNVAIINMTKAMANSLGPHGINVNAIYPGRTVTEATLERYAAKAKAEKTSVEALMKAADEKTLLKHVITADDVANVIAFLCSPLSIGIHGEAIGVDGGNRAEVHY